MLLYTFAKYFINLTYKSVAIQKRGGCPPRNVVVKWIQIESVKILVSMESKSF